MADIASIVEQLSKLTVLETAELVKQLEAAWGVSGAAPVAAAGAGSAAPAAATQAPVAEVQTSFDVVLEGVPTDKRIPIIKAVREVRPGLGLADAKNLVESVPKAVLEGVNKAEAEAAKKKLEDAGAKVELK